MHEILAGSELLDGLDPGLVSALQAVVQRRSLGTGDYLFLLGESADQLSVVLSGRLEVCFPLSFGGSMRDVAVAERSPGSTVGWSALVKPYRFTLSARATEPSQVASFPRQDLTRVLEQDGRLGQAFTQRIAEIVGRRFLTMQALWARELQRAVDAGLPGVQAGAQPG